MGGEFTTIMPVVSSNLKGAGYSYDIDAMEIEFLSGSLYIYFEVPPYRYDGLMAAPSKGKYFWQHIRRGTPYAYERLR